MKHNLGWKKKVRITMICPRCFLPCKKVVYDGKIFVCENCEKIKKL